jgi:hypothetical protein
VLVSWLLSTNSSQAIETLAENDDVTDKKTGLLDQPCEALVRGGWARALFHDRAAEELIAAVRAEIVAAAKDVTAGMEPVALPEHGGGPFPRDLAQAVADAVGRVQSEAATPEEALRDLQERVGIAGTGLSVEARRTLEKRVIAFLTAHRALLPGYFLPSVHKHPAPNVGGTT